MKNKITTEIISLSENDCFSLVDRYNDGFNFQIHRHKEYELHFLANCKGFRRVVGDSVEEIGDSDLVLLGHGIEHGWEQHNCTNDRIREIVIQFSTDLFGESFLAKNQLASIRKMLGLSGNGIAFSSEDIMKVYTRLDELAKTSVGFRGVISLMTVLYDLAEKGDYRVLSTSAFTSTELACDSRRVRKVQEHINANYKEEIRLADLADLVGMTPTSVSRFFKSRTGKSISDYVIDVRLGHVTRMLVDSTTSIAEICYDCGFNNISNFNRLFKKKKGNSPKMFRQIYQ